MGYAEERLDLIARLRKSAQGRTLSDTLRLDARTLRFHLGTSLADLRVPVHVDESVRAVLRSAVRDLFFLLALRHRSTLRESEYDSLILLDGFDPRAARQTSFNAPSSAKAENVRNAFLEAPELHPALEQEWLKRLAAAQSVNKVDAYTWSIETNDPDTVRTELKKLERENNLDIVSLHSESQSLEDVFRSLTQHSQ